MVHSIFQALVDDPSNKDIFLLPALTQCIKAGRTQTNDAMHYLREKRPEFCNQVSTFLNICNLRWPENPTPVDESMQELV